VLPADKVTRARAVVLDTLHEQWDCIDTQAAPLHEARIRDGAKGTLLTGYKTVTVH
jgi:hypothetical protein